jgi:small conductance mechanosensitive channel
VVTTLPALPFANIPPCWKDPAEAGSLCRKVYDWTGQEWLGSFADWLVAKPLTIALIVVVAIVVRALIHRAIRRLARKAAEGTVPGVLHRGPAASLLGSSPLVSARRKQRADTMASVLGSITTGVVYTVAGLMVLSTFNVNIAPLIASAGILGVALGFGSQALVKDFLSGIFMILEDQYGVGDAVDLGEASGIVEAVGLRVTRVRDVNGTVWYIRNGEVVRVGNHSQGWSRAVLDIEVARGTDVAHVSELLSKLATDMHEEAEWADAILEEPEVWGVEAITADALVLRLAVKTQSAQQGPVARELRARITRLFAREGIRVPQRAVWDRTPDDAPTPGAHDG